MFGLYMLAIYLGVAVIAAGFVALLVVVALVVTILALAWRIGTQAGSILSGLQQAERNTAGLK